MDRGANPHAHVLLCKRDDSDPLGKGAGADAVDQADAQQRAMAEMSAWMDQLWRAQDTLRCAVQNILGDAAVTDKRAAIGEAVAVVLSRIKDGAAGSGGTGGDVTKGTGAMTEAERVAKAETDRATAAADEVLSLCRQGGAESIAKAGKLLEDPLVYEAYQARTAGLPFSVPVEKKAAEVDHRAEIRRLVRANDTEALGKLLRDSGVYSQYRELMRAGELAPPPRKAA